MNALPSLTPTASAPTGTASSLGAGTEANAEGGFADALQQARQPQPAQPAQSGERTARPAGAAERPREGRSAESGKARARDQSEAADEAEAATTVPAARPSTVVDADTPADAAALATVGDAQLPPWLQAALARPARGADAQNSARAGAEGPSSVARTRDAAAAQRQAALAGAAAAAASGGAAVTASAAADPVAERPVFVAALQQAQAETPRGPAVAAEPVASPLGAAGAAPGSPASAATARAEAAERSLPTPMHSPEFAPALGAQLNLLVREGVTEARLHLNPAEMGPISVQIQIEGQTARVEMAAEQALTRQVLEQAMPVLAGALRDSGLTLAGGGVFEQRREPQGEAGGRPGGAPGRGGNEGAPAEEAAKPAPVPQGMVDLYA